MILARSDAKHCNLQILMANGRNRIVMRPMVSESPEVPLVKWLFKLRRLYMPSFNFGLNRSDYASLMDHMAREAMMRHRELLVLDYKSSDFRKISIKNKFRREENLTLT